MSFRDAGVRSTIISMIVVVAAFMVWPAGALAEETVAAQCASISAGLERQMNLHASAILVKCGVAPGGSSAGTPASSLATPSLSFSGSDVDVITGTETYPHVTQAESFVWSHGSTVVVNYNDGRGDAENPPNYSGVSVSKDGGATFTRLGSTSSPFTGHVGNYGDPIVVYNAKLGKWFAGDLVGGAGTGTCITGTEALGIGLWTSTNGETWTVGACAHVGSGNFEEGDDRESMWVDDNASSPHYGRMYISFNNFSVGKGALEVVHSDDGVTWSAPVALTSSFRRDVQLTGSPGSDGTVFIVGQEENEGGVGKTGQQNYMYRSTNGGETWTSTTMGPTFTMPGNTSCTRYFPGIYPIWRGTGWGQPAVGPGGVVQYVYAAHGEGSDESDILYVRSTNNGETWSAPVRLSTDSTGKAQWMPSLRVTPGGVVEATWYDRRNSTNGENYQRFARVSTNDGATWGPDEPLSTVLIPQPTQPDPYIQACYAGDYNYTTANSNTGFDTWTDGREPIEGHQTEKVFFHSIPLQSAPPSVTTEPATNVTAAGATLNGTVNPNGAETKYYFEYGTTISYGMKTSEVSAGSGTSNVKVSRAITGLTAGTTYHFRIVASNSAGTSHGGDLTFKTAPFFSSAFGSFGTGAGQFKEPADLKTDSSGNVWVADTMNSRVEEFNAEGKLIRTVGSQGTENGQFVAPYGLAIDSKGNLWVSDTSNDRLEEFTSEGVFVKAFGSYGSGNVQFNGPEGLSVDSKGNVYVADRGNKRIEELTSEGVYVKSIGTSGEGLLKSPTDAVLDASGDLWVTESEAARIVEFNPEGTFVRAWGIGGSGPGQLSSAYRLTVGPEGDIWIAEWGNNRVQVFTPTGEFVFQFGTYGTGEGQFNHARGIAIYGTNVYALDSGEWEGPSNNRVEKWVPTAPISPRAETTAATNVTATEATLNGIVNPDGAETKYYFEYDTKEYKKGEGPHGTKTPEASAGSGTSNVKVSRAITGLSAGIYHFRIVASNSVGTSYGEDVMFGTRPVFSSAFGSFGTGAGQFKEPADLKTDSSGNVWVADTMNSRVEEFNAEGKLIRTVGSQGTENGQFVAPYGLAIDSKGNLWVSDTSNDRLEEFTSEGVFVKAFGSYGSGNVQFNGPEGLSVDSKGNVYVADRGNKRIEELTSEGVYVKSIGTSGEGLLKSPTDAVLDASGDLWVTESEAARIVEFNPEGTFVRAWGIGGSGPGQLSSAYRLTVGPEGDIWIAEWGNNRVQVFTPTGEFVFQFGTYGTGEGQFNHARGIAIYGTNVYALDSGEWEGPSNNRVEKWTY
jgi:sugar lactone lactonase YvrE